MIKKLLFTAALLVPGLAYGQNPSTNLSAQVVRAGSDPIACDIGPAYTGQIPAAATQAGIIGCAANYDFTQTQSFTDNAGTHQWSNLSSWFTCNSNGGAPAILNFSGNVGCMDGVHQTITTDSGVQVLSLKYLYNRCESRPRRAFHTDLWRRREYAGRILHRDGNQVLIVKLLQRRRWLF